jgi:hypothetical protein
VKLQHVHRRPLEAGEVAAEALLDLRRDVLEVLDVEAELGREVGCRAGFRDQPGERFLGLAVPVLRRGVDPVDPARQRAADRFPLRRVVLVDDDAADGAGAEDDLGDLDAGAAESAVFQMAPPRLGTRNSRFISAMELMPIIAMLRLISSRMRFAP